MPFLNDLYGSLPGESAAYETFENYFRWGRDYAGLIVGAQLDGSARDSGNSPTFILRPGLLLGAIASSGNLRDYGGTNTDGSDQVVGVLLSSFRMQDVNGNNMNRFVWILAGGPVRALKLLGLDEQARVTMAGRFLFDDRNYIPNLNGWTRTIAKTANYTVLATDVGTRFTTTGNAAAITFTLPATPAKGMRFRFENYVAYSMTITAPANTLIGLNGATYTHVAFSTASYEIGAVCEIYVDDTGTKYVATPLAGTAAYS